jgi:hypothetical protein
MTHWMDDPISSRHAILITDELGATDAMVEGARRDLTWAGMANLASGLWAGTEVVRLAMVTPRPSVWRFRKGISAADKDRALSMDDA